MSGRSRPRISAIIPTLNEASTISACVADLLRQGADEIIVADAASPDGTAEIARGAGARVLESPRGRGIQQNHGASAASGVLLLFLHADCRLEEGSINLLRAFHDAQPLAPGGCFRMRVDDPSPLYRLVDRAGDLRAAMLGLPYGDQAIFARREAFDRVGGFDEVPLMEDVYFALKLRKLGRIVVLNKYVHVSARRWKARGLARQTCLNWSLTLAAAAGVSPARLSRFYPPLR